MVTAVFVHLPLVTKPLLGAAESAFYDGYWHRLSVILDRDLTAVRFSSADWGNRDSQPAYDICELPLWIAALAPLLGPACERIQVIDLFDLSAARVDLAKIDERLKTAPTGLYLMSPLVLNVDVALAVARLVKKHHGIASRVLFGGPFATYQDLDLMVSTDVDAVFRGRADIGLADLCLALQDGSRLDRFTGLTWRDNGRIVRNNIATAQQPPVRYDYTAIPAKYAGRVPWARLYCSEGCPWNCAFCADVIWNRTKPRYKEVHDILADAELIANRFGVDTFYVGDETFTYDPDFVRHFAAGMKAAGLQWFCQTRVDHVDPQLLEAMRVGNCRMVKFGAESANQHILDLIHKNIRIDQIRTACRMVKDAGMSSFTYWLVGLPGETEATGQTTIAYVEDLLAGSYCDLIEWFICVPYPGTDLYCHPERYGISISDLPWSHWREDSTSVLSTQYESAERLYALWEDGLARFAPLLARY